MKLPVLIAMACSSLAVGAAAYGDTAFRVGPRDSVLVTFDAPARDLLASLSPPEVAAQDAMKRPTSRSCDAPRRVGPRETIIACR
jgi:hypothetical protein